MIKKDKGVGSTDYNSKIEVYENNKLVTNPGEAWQISGICGKEYNQGVQDSTEFF